MHGADVRPSVCLSRRSIAGKRSGGRTATVGTYDGGVARAQNFYNINENHGRPQEIPQLPRPQESSGTSAGF